MTPATARRVADVVLAAVVLGASIYVLRAPSLRRLAWRAGMTALTGAIPAWLGREVQQAWADSGHRRV